jgi:hypothetical protein
VNGQVYRDNCAHGTEKGCTRIIQRNAEIVVPYQRYMVARSPPRLISQNGGAWGEQTMLESLKRTSAMANTQSDKLNIHWFVLRRKEATES